MFPNRIGTHERKLLPQSGRTQAARTRLRPCASRPRCGAGQCGARCAIHLPDAPGSAAGRSRQLSEMRNGAGTDDAQRNRGRQRAARHDTPFHDRRCALGAAAGTGDGADAGSAPERRLATLDRAGPGQPRSAVGRLAVLRAWRAVAAWLEPQHVHADRPGFRRRLCVFVAGDRGTRTAARSVSGQWPSTAVFRGRCSHRDTGAAGPGTGTARTCADFGRDPRPAQAGAEDRASRRCPGPGKRCGTGSARNGRSAKGAPRRKSTGGWAGAGRRQPCRRVDAQR